MVDPSDGTADRDFVAPDGDSHGITFLDSRLFVSVDDDGFRQIVELDPDTGSEVSSFEVDFLPGDTHAGLANDGENLVVAPEFDTIVVFVDPDSGSEVSTKFFFEPGQFFEEEGPGALAFTTSTPQFYTAKGDVVRRFGEEGNLIREFPIEDPNNVFGGIQGAVFVGSLLYLAESQGDTVQAALVPSVEAVRTTKPRAMATDGDFLYLVVDAEPEDKLMKLDPNTPNSPLVTSFGDGGAVDAPGTDIDAIAFHGDGFLYTLSNDLRSIETPQGVFQFALPVLNRIDPETGRDVAFFPILIEFGVGEFDFLIDPIDALASDGNFLYGGARATDDIEGVWFKIDIDDLEFIEAFGEIIGGPVAEEIQEFEGQLDFMPGFQSMEVTTGPEFPASRALLGSGSLVADGSGPADTIARFDRDDGTMFREVIPGATNGQFRLTGTDIKGMAYTTSSKLLFLADDASDKILSTKLPENTGEELTVVGSYDTDLVVDVDSTTNQNVTSVTYSIIRNPEVVVTLDSPVDDFVATSTQTTISGLLNDPSILSVDVGIQLPFTSFVDDSVVDDTASLDIWDITDDGSAALWHIACNDDPSQGFPFADEPRFSSSPCSWRFGIPTPDGTFSSFNTGVDTIPTGALTTADTIPVGADTELDFFTGYITEGTADVDIKLVEVAVVTTDPQGNEIIGGFETILQIVAPGEDDQNEIPANAHPDFEFVQLPPLFINPSLVQVSFDLSPFAGDDIKLRFRFDADDDIGNDEEGWYLDDIEVSGAGTQTVQVNTTLLDPPEVVTVNGTSTTFFREYSRTFTLSEGANVVVADADQPYSPFLTGSAQASGFVDTLAPVVTLAGLPNATNDASQTLTGTIDETTLVSLIITQSIFDGVNATTSNTILALGTVPEGGTFSAGVSLGTGINTFSALATDRGNKEGTAEETSIGDFTPPSGIVQIIGVTSEDEALVEDDFFVVVSATDNIFGSGVATVETETGDPLADIVNVPAILVEMHGLDTVTVGGNASSTTHVQLSDVVTGTPVGLNSITLTVIDEAGNSATATGDLNVVSARSNRNFFLFPSFNFMGLALIPDDGDANTDNDASLDRLMDQDVTDRVNPDFAALLPGGTATLGDVVESTFAFNKAGNFIVHTPGPGATDTLTDLEPFQGMIINTNTTAASTDIFKKVSVAGFTATQSVPIRINIQGVFFRQVPGQIPEAPPDKELRVGYNLVAPHILIETLFDRVYRGALIPDELAVSAIGFERRVDATSDGSDIDAEITEEFVSNSIGDFLKAVFSYWTFIVDDVADTRLNELGDQKGPTITP